MNQLYFDSHSGLMPIKVLDVWIDNNSVTGVVVVLVETLEDQMYRGHGVRPKGRVFESFMRDVVHIAKHPTRSDPSYKVKTAPLESYWNQPLRKRWQSWNSCKWIDCNPIP